MARLPQPADIQRRTAPANTPDINPGAIDYGPLIGRSGSAGAIGKGFGDIAKVGMDYAAQLKANEAEVDDYETKKRLLDLGDQLEREQEDYRRRMPAGGNGYSDGWRSWFQERAAGFVGEGDANIPAAQRGKVGLALKQLEARLHERAWREENGERDRHTIAGMEETVGRQRDRVLADPDRHDEVQANVAGLIEQARREGKLTPETRAAYLAKSREEIAYAALEAKAQRATSRAGLDAAHEAIAPNRVERRARTAVDPSDVLGSANRFFLDKGLAPHQAAAIAGNMRWESGGKPDLVNPNDNLKNSPNSPHSIGIGQWNDRAPALLAFARSRGVEIPDGNLRDVNYARTVAKAIPLDVQLEFAWHEMQTTEKRAFDRIREAGDLRSASEGAISYHRPAGWTRGNPSAGHGFTNRMGLADQALKSGARPSGRDGGTTDAGMDDTPLTGPRAYVPPQRAAALWAQAQTRYAQTVSETERMITAYEGNAALGILPPAAALADIGQRVQAIGDPVLTAKYQSTFAFADMANQIAALPIDAQRQEVARIRSSMGERRTPEQEGLVKKLETLVNGATTLIEKDPLTHAAKNGLELPVIRSQASPADPGSFRAGQEEGVAQLGVAVQKVRVESLDFNAPDIVDRLQRQAETARNVARYHDRAPVYFTAQQADALTSHLEQGGPRMLHVLGTLYRGLGSDMPKALADSAGERAPEIAMIGKMVAEGYEPRIILDAANGLALKRQKGFVSSLNAKDREPLVDTASQVLGKVQGLVSPVIRTADTIYESRHLSEGKKTFDVRLYTQIVKEVMGETTDPKTGRIFGGIGSQSTGWFSSTNVLVPPSIQQNSIGAALGAIKISDLPVVPVALDDKGTAHPLPIADITRAQLVTVGTGRYLLQTGTSGGEPNYAMDPRNGRPFVLDMNPILPAIRQRKPEIFKGYDPSRKPTP